MLLIDLTGRKVNSLLVIKRATSRGQKTFWLCRCDCGVELEIWGGHLASKKNPQKSCKECLRKRKIRHGMSDSKENKAWQDMKARCTRPKTTHYEYYGGRGIKVCNRWFSSFENFFSDMGYAPSPKHSIERKNVNGDYEPTNCIWATKKVQARNTRTNRFIVINGECRCVIEWCEIFNIQYGTFWRRTKAGWDEVSALTKPLRYIHNK